MCFIFRAWHCWSGSSVHSFSQCQLLVGEIFHTWLDSSSDDMVRPCIPQAAFALVAGCWQLRQLLRRVVSGVVPPSKLRHRSLLPTIYVLYIHLIYPNKPEARSPLSHKERCKNWIVIKWRSFACFNQAGWFRHETCLQSREGFLLFYF